MRISIEALQSVLGEFSTARIGADNEACERAVKALQEAGKDLLQEIEHVQGIHRNVKPVYVVLFSLQNLEPRLVSAIQQIQAYQARKRRNTIGSLKAQAEIYRTIEKILSSFETVDQDLQQLHLSTADQQPGQLSGGRKIIPFKQK